MAGEESSRLVRAMGLAAAIAQGGAPKTGAEAVSLDQIPAQFADGVESQPQQPEIPSVQYCVFRAGRERFTLAVLDVEEVVEWPNLTKVPLSPSFLMGIFNLRGSIVPVIDIAFTEVRRPDLTPKHVVVACLRGKGEENDVRLGIAADEVIGTYTTNEPLMVDEAPKDVPHCCGMLRHEDRLALALDLKRVIQSFPVGVI